MDESEALCNKIAIMAAGQFKCIGTSRHIKHKFGRGFSLIIKCRRSIEPTNDVAMLEKFIIENIPRSTIKETQYDSIFVRISYDKGSSSKKRQNIADLFYLLESNKDYLNIESYSISETSLEQVFLFLAKSKNKLKAKKNRDSYKI
jgi:ATP-binding cassette subfamily A (ABC1) protein 3